MANICKLCNSADPAAVRAAFASGASDRQIARRFGCSHVSVGRHRRAHLVAPMQAAAAALDKGRSLRQDRAQQLAAIEAGDPSAIVSVLLNMQSQVVKLQRVEERLERLAAVAEAESAPTVVAHLAGQQLKGIEVASRLGGLGAYARREGDGAPTTSFHLTINIPGQERPPVIDAFSEVPREADEQ